MQSTKISSIDGIDLDVVTHSSLHTHPIGGIVQAHGITADMDEGGMFVRLADRLAETGFDVLRFTYRGHGRSGGTQRGVTIAGEMLDLQAALDFAPSKLAKPLAIVAASFGAVSTCLLLPYIKELHGLVLWNPVLDLKRTFVEPELPWGRCNFNEASIKHLNLHGYLLLDNSFEIGHVLYEEMKHYNPYRCFVESSIPSLIIHGNRDTYVPYDVSSAACHEQKNCRLYTIEGSDHGFDSREKEDKAITITIDWLCKLFKK